MGKFLEAIQWIILILLLIYVVVVSVVGFIYLPKAAVNIVELISAYQSYQSFDKNVHMCETASDCAYGKASKDIRNFGLGSIIKSNEGEQQIIEFEGCLNSEEIEEELSKPFNEPCKCVAGRCGAIR